MEFRLAKLSDTEAVKNLWAYCFEPKEDPFFQYYFNECYEPENTLLGLEEGQLLSTVHLRQYDLSVRGQVIPVSYMVGVATHPAARRGGLGGQLLKASLEDLRRRGQGITILMPSKAAFYQQYGWELYCHQWVQKMDLDDLRPLTDRSLHFGLLNSPDQWEWLAPVYDQYTAGLSGYALRGSKEWRRLLGSFFAEGINVAVVRNDEQVIEGYIVYRLGQAEIMVSEMVYSTRRGQKALLNYIYNHRSQGQSVRWNEGFHDQGFRLYPDGKQGHETMPFMMARIVDVKRAFESIGSAHQAEGPLDGMSRGEEKTIKLGLKDSLCQWNQGVFELTISPTGSVTVEKLSSHLDSQDLDVATDVGALTLLLMGAMTASELKFEGRLQAQNAIIDLLESYWAEENCYINEWW